MFYETTIKYTAPNDHGDMEQQTHRYMVEGETFTDVELTVNKVFSARAVYDIDLTAARRSPVVEIVDVGTGNTYYRAKVSQPFTDEKGRRKDGAPWFLLVMGTDLDNAKAVLNEHLKQGYGEIVVEAVVKTKFEGVL